MLTDPIMLYVMHLIVLLHKIDGCSANMSLNCHIFYHRFRRRQHTYLRLMELER